MWVRHEFTWRDTVATITAQDVADVVSLGIGLATSLLTGFPVQAQALGEELSRLFAGVTRLAGKFPKAQEIAAAAQTALPRRSLRLRFLLVEKHVDVGG